MRDPAIAHLGLRVGSLGALRQAYLELKQRQVPIRATLNHGVALAIYLTDPGGNLVELYWPTNKEGFWLPFIRPVDLDQSEEALMEVVAETKPGANGRRTDT